MTQYYVGVKIVTAWPQEKDGRPGYAVKYEDGFVSWSPKDVFEKAYLAMGEANGNKVTQEMVDAFVGNNVNATQVDNKTTMVRAETLTGFRQYETSSCVDPANFNMDVGTQCCLKRIKDTIWKCLGFVVQWGRFGLNASRDGKVE